MPQKTDIDLGKLEKRMDVLEEKIRVLHHRSIANQGAMQAKDENPYESLGKPGKDIVAPEKTDG